VAELLCLGEFLVEEDGVEGEVGLGPAAVALGGDLAQIGDREIVGGTRAHVDLTDAEVHGVGAGAQGGGKGFPRAGGSHELDGGGGGGSLH
jgi:hypothetical protein